MITVVIYVYWIFCAVAFGLGFICGAYICYRDYMSTVSDKHSFESPRNASQRAHPNRSRKTPSALSDIPEETDEYSPENV